MVTYHILYNPCAGNGRGEKEAHKLDVKLKGENKEYINLLEVGNCEELFEAFPSGDKVVIVGGDGTLNHLVNDIDITKVKNEILYLAAGSGNDFLRDLGVNINDMPIPINKYLENLPTVTVNGKTIRFLNGIGYGIDGYCCEEGDKKRKVSNKPINYTPIAVKGISFGYKRANAEIMIDGKEYSFKKVWIAPTMNGRFYGGGMMAAPGQYRLNKEGTVSLMVMYGQNKIKSLIVFPSIFQGEHVKHTEMVTGFKGHEITVKFDRPTALQVDGETIIGVTEYSVSATARKEALMAVR